MSKIEEIKLYIKFRIDGFIIRNALPLILKYSSEAEKYRMHTVLSDSCEKDFGGVEEYTKVLYEEASKLNRPWEWKLAEVLDDFYKKTSWIEVV